MSRPHTIGKDPICFFRFVSAIAVQLAKVQRLLVHDLRHSHAAALIEMNVAPKLLQERLGHERIQTTLDTYGHLYPNAQAEVARKLEAFMTEG